MASVEGNSTTNEIQSEAMNIYYDAVQEKPSHLVGKSGLEVQPKQGVQVPFPVLFSADSSMPFTHTSTMVHPQSQHGSLQSTCTPATEHIFQALDQGTLLTSPQQQSANLSYMLKKQNELTNILVQQQILSTLPKGTLSVFDGDLLQYKAFIHAFEHMVERKTDNDQDWL